MEVGCIKPDKKQRHKHLVKPYCHIGDNDMRIAFDLYVIVKCDKDQHAHDKEENGYQREEREPKVG
jgi:hypothetical protein